MGKKPSSVNDRDLKKAAEEIRDIRELLDDLKEVGIEAPAPLVKSLNGLQKAIDTAQDVGEAFEEASAAVKQYEKNLNEVCKGVDADMRDVCEANVARKYQVRAIKFTLDPKNKDSVSAKFLKKTIQRYTPAVICKHWDYCAKQDDDKQKK
jgi:hypothetical protein